MMKTITQKALTAVIVSAFCILTLNSAISYVQLRSQQWNAYEQEKQALANQLQVILMDSIFSYDLPVLQKAVDSYTPHDLVANISIFDQKERLMVASKSEKSTQEMQRIPITYTDDKSIGTIVINYSADSVHTALSNKIYETIGFTLITLVSLSLCLFFLLQKILVRPIKRVALSIEAVHKNGNFDLTQRIELNSNDEIGRLTKAFNHLIDNVSTTISTVQQNIEQVSNWLRDFDEMSKRTTNTTQDQQKITAHTLSHIQDLKGAAENIVASTDKTASDCKESLDTVKQQEKYVEASLQLVRKLVNELGANAEKANELKEASNSIGSVLGVIKSIAEQTNLLALNAAIEAARAGKSGRGFAVVADEVRTLAQRTQESTSEIESIIVELQDKTEDTYNRTQQGQKMVTEAISLTEKNADSFRYISEKIFSIDHKVGDIVTAARHQEQLSNEVNHNMEAALCGSEKLAQDMLQIHSNSKNVISAEQELKRTIERFKF